MSEQIEEVVRAAMRRAYNLGQTYWQQADSEYTSHHKKADVTAGRFIELNDETCAAVVAAIASQALSNKPPHADNCATNLDGDMRGTCDCQAPRQALSDAEIMNAD